RVAEELPTIGAPEGRAGEHDVAPLGQPTIDRGRQLAEPRRAVGLVEGNTAAHLLPVLCGVERVCVGEGEAERAGEHPPDRGLAGARDAHDEEDHRWRY